MKIRKDFLPYALPFFDDHELNGVRDAIQSNWWSKGPKTAEFEKTFAEYVGARHALALNSCTAALHIALLSHKIGEGDEVITTPMTFCSTANVIVHAGAIPVFADIDFDTGLIDPGTIESKITEKTRAILPVHYAGQACDMDKINAIAAQYNLKVIEDASHAVYATYQNKMVGGLGNPTAFSFYATKNLAIGEGGMLTGDDDAFMEKSRLFSLHGMSKNAWNRYGKGSDWHYDVLYAGFKYNMTDIGAALGLAQLKKLEKMQKIRKKIADVYTASFQDLPGISPLKVITSGRHAWHLYMIRIDENQYKITRDEFIEKLNGAYYIGTSVHFIPVHLHPFYRNTFQTGWGDCPVCEKYFKQILSLPLYPGMKEEDVYYVAEAVSEIAGNFSK